MNAFRSLTEETKKKYIDFGNYVIKTILNNQYKNIGVFAISPDDINDVWWIKSMFHGCEIEDAIIEAPLEKDDKTFANISDYDMVILLNLQFNNKQFDISFEHKKSSDIGIVDDIPIIQLNYFFDTNNFVTENDSHLVSDGISNAKHAKSMEIYKKCFAQLTPRERSAVFKTIAKI